MRKQKSAKGVSEILINNCVFTNAKLQWDVRSWWYIWDGKALEVDKGWVIWRFRQILLLDFM